MEVIEKKKSAHSLYKVFTAMKQRCYNQNCIAYKDYGGRGIYICEEWLYSYDSFFNWAINNGYQKGKILDRENNDGIYSPENCRFVNKFISIRNRRNTIMIEYNGKVKPLSEWSAFLDISYSMLSSRLKKGLPVNLAFDKSYTRRKRVVNKTEAKLIGETVRKYVKFHGRKQSWIVKKMNEAGFNISESIFSDKITGEKNIFNKEESEFILTMYN